MQVCKHLAITRNLKFVLESVGLEFRQQEDALSTNRSGDEATLVYQ